MGGSAPPLPGVGGTVWMPEGELFLHFFWTSLEGVCLLGPKNLWCGYTLCPLVGCCVCDLFLLMVFNFYHFSMSYLFRFLLGKRDSRTGFFSTWKTPCGPPWGSWAGGFGMGRAKCRIFFL